MYNHMKPPCFSRKIRLLFIDFFWIQFRIRIRIRMQIRIRIRNVYFGSGSDPAKSFQVCSGLSVLGIYFIFSLSIFKLLVYSHTDAHTAPFRIPNGLNAAMCLNADPDPHPDQDESFHITLTVQ
jgi:hypothetical protein